MPGYDSPAHELHANPKRNCSLVQLETIYVLEGLGPPKDPIQKGKTFKDQVSPTCSDTRPAASVLLQLYLNEDCWLINPLLLVARVKADQSG